MAFQESNSLPRAALEFVESLNPVHSRLVSQPCGIFQWPLVPGGGHQVSVDSLRTLLSGGPQGYRGM